MHDVAEFLETDLGKRKLTYVGVTMSVVILWHPLPHDVFFFFPKPLRPLRGLEKTRVATREESGVLGLPSRRGLTPRGSLECNPVQLNKCLSPSEQLERQAEVHSCTQDKA